MSLSDIIQIFIYLKADGVGDKKRTMSPEESSTYSLTGRVYTIYDSLLVCVDLKRV